MAKIFSKFTNLLIFILCVFIGALTVYKGFNVIPQREEVKIAVKNQNKPFSFVDSDGNVQGFEVDVIKSIFQKLDIKYKFVPVFEDEVVPAMKSDLYDIAIGEITCKKKVWGRDIGCSYSFLKGENVLYKRKDSKKDFAYQNIAIESLVSSYKNIKALFPLADILEFENSKDLFEYFRNGTVIAILANNLKIINAKKEGQLLAGDIEKISCTQSKKLCKEKNYVFIFPRNSKLRNKINNALIEFKKSPEYKELKDKWF